MRIHYVEDDKADVLALRHVLRARTDVTIDTSERLEQIGGDLEYGALDALVIDVMRPDAISIENDLRLVRSHTQAPVMFVTGLDPELYRQRALQAGAQAVISKDALNADLLDQFLQKARPSAARRPSPAPEPWLEVEGEVPMDRAPIFPMSEPSLSSVSATLSYVKRQLVALSRAAPGADAGSEPLLEIIDLLRLLKLISLRPFGTAVSCDAAALLQGLKGDFAARAARRDIDLSMEIGDVNAQWWSLGSEAHAKAGLEAMLRGFITACDADDWLDIALRYADGQSRLEISSNQQRIADVSDAFLGDVDDANAAMAFMQCGLHLLALRPEQIETSVHAVTGVFIYF